MKITRTWECRKSLLIALIIVSFGTGVTVAYTQGEMDSVEAVVGFCKADGAFMVGDKAFTCKPIKVKGIQS